MEDILQLASDRIQKFKAHAEAAKNAQDKTAIAQAFYDARTEFLVIQNCFDNVITEGELIINGVMRRIGLEFPDYEKKVDTTAPVPHQTQEQFVVPQYLGGHIQSQEVTPVQEAMQQAVP